jgi:hypothetical protein
MNLPISITIDQADRGRLRARLNDEEPFEAESLDDLVSHLVKILRQIRDDLEDSWDLEKSREAMEEIRRGEIIPWEQVKAELGL